MSDQQMPTFWITGYLPNGCKISFTVPFELAFGYRDALTFTDDLLAKGFTTNEPGLNEGESGDVITTVMRRAKGDGTPIIDFFTDWGKSKAGKEAWGTFKYFHMYLNDDQPEMIADFLKASGFKSLEQIPLYDGQNPLKRTEGKVHPKETKVPTPFKLIKEQGEERLDSDGKPYRPWKLVRYEALSGQSVDKSTGELTDKPAQPKADTDTTWMTNQEAVKQLVSALATWSGLSATELLGNVNIVTSQSTSRWSELKNITRSDVWAAVVLTRVNQDKDKALAMVSDDENKRKSIIYWADKNTDIAF